MLDSISDFLACNPESNAYQISEGTGIPKRQVNGILYRYRGVRYRCDYSSPIHTKRPYWSVKGESTLECQPPRVECQPPRVEYEPPWVEYEPPWVEYHLPRFWSLVVVMCVYYLAYYYSPTLPE